MIDANNIVDVIGSYVKLTKKGNTYFGLCPFHNEKTPSFSVTDNGAKQMFYCFGCHKGGSVLTFIMEYESCSYTDAVKMLAQRAGIALPEPDYSKAELELTKRKAAVLQVNKEAAIYFYRLLKSQRGTRALEYLRGRGLSDETIRNYGLGFADIYRDNLYKYIKSKGFSDEVMRDSGLFSIKESDTHDFFWNRAMFPVMDTSNRVIAFGGRVMGDGEPKYLNTSETIVFDKSRTLFGLNVAKRHKGKEFILCEGYMDVISLHQAGFTNAVASLGTAFTANHANVLKRYAQSVVISYDSDLAGQDAALRAIPKLREAGLMVRVADLKPYKDPDELIKACGNEEYAKRIAGAANALIFEIRILRNSYNLDNPDEKTRFDNEVASRISVFEDDAARENYARAVAKEFDLDLDTLRGIIKRKALTSAGIKTTDVPIRSGFNKKTELPDGLALCQKMLLAYLADDKSLYEKTKGHLSEEDFNIPPYDTIARILFNQLESGRLNPSGIISAFEDVEGQEAAASVLQYHTEVDQTPESLRSALNDCIIRIKNNTIQRRLAQESDVMTIIALKKEQETLKTLKIL